MKAGFNALSGRTRVVEAGERIELRFHAEPFRIALFRVDVLDFAHEPYGLADSSKMATAWTRHQRNPEGCLRKRNSAGAECPDRIWVTNRR